MKRLPKWLVVMITTILMSGSIVASADAGQDNKLSNQLKSYLEAKGSPLASYSSSFVRWGKHYGVDPRFLVAVSGAETHFGRESNAQRLHNAWGIGPHYDLHSWPNGIKNAARILGTYYRERPTVSDIQRKWAPGGVSNDPTGLNYNWVRNVSHFYRELGGNPNGGIFNGSPKVALEPSAPRAREEPRFISDSLAYVSVPTQEPGFSLNLSGVWPWVQSLAWMFLTVVVVLWVRGKWLTPKRVAVRNYKNSERKEA